MAAIIGDAQEARELIALTLDRPRYWPLLAAGEELDAGDAAALLAAASARATGAPMQYAAGHAWFRDLTLEVDARVLIPRPETELLVDLVLEVTAGEAGGVAVDVGTGSGAIALSLAAEGHFERVIATDVSLDALDVARRNAVRTATDGRVDFRHGALLSPVAERQVRAVVSNPPYIAFDEAAELPNSVRDWEPAVALYAGRNGLAITTDLVRQAAPVLRGGGVLALEVDVRRAATVAEYVAAQGAYENVRVVLDLTGRERFVVATRREDRE
ncbi:MAG TPA: peptide chain release factor N(5)-glutamine methyltransferase [Gemmatimonadaceae bacterium]